MYMQSKFIVEGTIQKQKISERYLLSQHLYRLDPKSTKSTIIQMQNTANNL